MPAETAPTDAPAFRLQGRRVFIAGHRGMVGSALCRRLGREDCTLLTVGREALDLTRQQPVEDWMAEHRPEVVIVAAGKVGGILANDRYPADFLYENLLVEANLIHAAHRIGVAKLLFLGSSCIYPREAPQPMAEESLLTGPLEPTNEWYAMAKIAGIKLCEAYRRQHGDDFISAMPCNLYGPNDYFHPDRSHVIPGMMRRFHEATGRGDAAVTCWGSGTPRREFLHVDDLADGCIHLLRHYSAAPHVNVGTGSDITVAALAEAMKQVTGFPGEILWDRSKPDGMMLKRMDTGRIAALGWAPRIAFADGLAATYRWFLEQPALRA